MSEKEKVIKELTEIAPGLPREAPPTPFGVPSGYFEQLPATVIIEAQKSTAKKVIAFTRRPWKQLAAAAILTGVLLSSLYFYLQNTPDINANPEGWVKKELNTISDEKLNSFVNLTHAADSLNETNSELAIRQQEIASLTNDISNEEIQALLSEISQTVTNETVNE